ncbi:MAG: pyruvate kinase [Pirellulaceae bacterium]
MTVEPLKLRARTKIVATVGPACRAPERLRELIEAGVDVFRINMAHGTRAQHETEIADIRRISGEVGRPVGILVDLAGPKIRLGELFQEPTECDMGAEYQFVRGQQATGPDVFTSNYERLIDELDIGNIVMLADGTVGMQVVGKTADSVTCRVTASGPLRSRQGINLPGANLSVPAMTDDDWTHAEWAAGQQVDFVSLSFVRTDVEILQLRERLQQLGSQALVIAKIEKREALENLESIVVASDGIMVARGDLGVETDVAEMPLAQKRVIACCRRLMRPVIVATQMLDSMTHSKRPTRAEATDVANAILDGADACMLSGETAVGDNPRETVEMMNRILLATERSLADAPAQELPVAAVAGVHPITTAVAFGAARIASQLFARLVVIATRRGGTARVKSKLRDVTPTIGVSDNPVTLRQMCLYWGITPLAVPQIENDAELRRFIDVWGKDDGTLRTGDRVVFVTGSELMASAHNAVVVHEVE